MTKLLEKALTDAIKERKRTLGAKQIMSSMKNSKLVIISQSVPTAIANFPKEMSAWPPRSYVDRIFNIKRWTNMSRGGHFAALEQPDLLVDDIRAFVRTLR